MYVRFGVGGRGGTRVWKVLLIVAPVDRHF